MGRDGRGVVWGSWGDVGNGDVAIDTTSGGDDFLVSVVANLLKNRWIVIPINISLVVYCFTARRACVSIILFSG
jgi:hypothetical protein